MATPVALFAEGSAQTNVNASFSATAQILRASTVVYVDILDVSEAITFHGRGSIDVFFDPDPLPTPGAGTFIGTFSDGGVVTPSSGVGAYRIHFSQDQVEWDLAVNGAAGGYGRVWSFSWSFDAQTFLAGTTGGSGCFECRVFDSENGSFDYSGCTGCDGRMFASFYALVGGGASDRDGVVELRTDGMAGFLYSVHANAVGLAGTGGRSVGECLAAEPVGCPPLGAAWTNTPACSAAFPAEFPIYLLPPEVAQHNVMSPGLASAGMEYDSELCSAVAAGVSGATVTFSTDVDGVYHVVCDADIDGLFDFTSDDDVALIGRASPGTVSVPWDGTDNRGQAVPAGTVECQVFVTVGEVHFVGRDVETVYPGNRWFEVDFSGSRLGLPIFWNDAAVDPGSDVHYLMPNGELPLASSGPDGIASGSYADVAEPNVNARGWGAFLSSPGTGWPSCPSSLAQLSKGDWTWLDSYTWLEKSSVTAFTVDVLPLDDTDGDGLLDPQEECLYGTNPALSDSDFDGLDDPDEVVGDGVGFDLPTDPLDRDSDDDAVDDGIEVGPDLTSPRNTDGDALIDALDVDDDDDLVQTVNEDPDGDGLPINDDTDDDGLPNYRDPDDDGDGLLTVDEDLDLNGDPRDDHTDNDGVPNYLDSDDDDDLVLTRDEDVDLDGDPRNDDTDDDGVPDYLDSDDDGDGVPTLNEDLNLNSNPRDDDTDDDAVPDYLDSDDDGDGVPTLDEDLNGNGDPRDDDSDRDGIPDYLDPFDDMPIFLDDFESGSTSSWSRSVGSA